MLHARLSDAKFFWDQDKKRTLESRVADLKDIVFHAKLGTQLERVERIEALAGEIAKIIGADVEKSKRAARLAKADLTTGVVGEFPELQGIMGRYYALNDGEAPEIADAIRDHYKPLGPSDQVPTAKVSIAVALADKMDTLAAFFAIDEKPTGSGDPYAIRRAALGIIRLILTNNLRLSIRTLVKKSYSIFASRWAEASRWFAPLQPYTPELGKERQTLLRFSKDGPCDLADMDVGETIGFFSSEYPNEPKKDQTLKSTAGLIFLGPLAGQLAREVLKFFAERLKATLRESGRVRHDLIEAVFVLQAKTICYGSRIEVELYRISSRPMTARTCWSVTAAPRTSSRSKKRRTSASIATHPTPPLWRRPRKRPCRTRCFRLRKRSPSF